MAKNKKGVVEMGIESAAKMVVASFTTTVNRLEKEHKLNKKQADKMIKEATAQYNAVSSKYGKEVQKQVDNLVKSSPFATKAEVDALKAKIEKLTKTKKSRK